MKSAVSKDDQITSGFYSLLEHPKIYSLFQWIMGSHNKYSMYVNDYLKPPPMSKILDIGCGFAQVLNFLPKDVEYTGYDISQSYIRYAREMFGQRATFHNMRVNEMRMHGKETFDIVLADGLLHHLNDDEAKELFKTGFDALKQSGFMFTSDPTFIKNQKCIPWLISKLDRGKHVRYPNEYKQIAETQFPYVEAFIIHNISNRPQTGCFLRCYKEQPAL